MASFFLVRQSLTLVFALLPVSLTAQVPDSSSVRGFLIDAYTALPVPRVQVLIVRQRDTIARVATDSLGTFIAPAQFGQRLRAHFRRIGYVADSLEFDVGELPIRVAMNSTVPITGLQTISVREKAFNSFERRAGRSAAGTFISLAKIEERKPQRTSQLFRGLAGITLGDSAGLILVYSNRANSARRRAGLTLAPALDASGVPVDSAPSQSSFGNCPMRTRIDGILQPPGSSLDDIRPEDIYGIEVYNSGVAVPAEYQTVQSEAECGLILIWLKRSKERLKK